jgi:hypothetical protein
MTTKPAAKDDAALDTDPREDALDEATKIDLNDTTLTEQEAVEKNLAK